MKERAFCALIVMFCLFVSVNVPTKKRGKLLRACPAAFADGADISLFLSLRLWNQQTNNLVSERQSPVFVL